MKIEISYATMSYLRELVKKDQHKYWKDLFVRRGDISPEQIQEEWDKYWKFYDMTPQISKQSCIVAVLKECDRIENECQKALKG